MKFIRAIANCKKQDIDRILSNLNEYEKKRYSDLEQSFDSVMFIEKNGFVAIYAAVDDDTIGRMFSEYIKLGISFSYEDLSRFVLFGNTPEISGESEILQLKSIVNKFLEENLKTDIVLEKIYELGIHTLSDIDRLVLESH